MVECSGEDLLDSFNQNERQILAHISEELEKGGKR